ncbi:MAG TPA: sigma-70 family RNA polymerase sigma factor [Gemmataceae bacterium]|nr:sigma-70 family RNA polymerase sigma factor [Gemmataceae bacterium]
MASHQTNTMSGVLVRALRPAADGRTDGALLGAFIDRRDPAAFAELVRRHGPMVLGVCSRVLGNVHDAEDAFQATFLVLARKAGAVSPRNAVGNWLYGVAHQTAVRVRAITMKRRGRESLRSVPDPAVPDPGWDDLAAVLDEELGRLPDHYRAVIVLCDVEGRTRPDAAAHLGCPEGSVSSRLSRARAMLARRLTRRGVTLSAGVLAVLLAENASSARVPAALVQSTVAAAGGSALAPGVATITDGVMKAMLMTKLRTAALAAVAVGVVGLSGIAGLDRSGGQDPARPAKAKTEVERFLAPVPRAVKRPDDDRLIQGTWTVVDLQQVNHEPTKEEREAWKAGQFTITFTARQMVFNVDKSGMTYRLDPTGKPPVVEWLDGGKVIARGIYGLSGDDLKVCMGRKPDMGEPEAPTDFDIQKAKPGTFPTLFVMKRQAPRKVADPAAPGGWWVLRQAPLEDPRPATRVTIPDRYDFRESASYKALTADQREKLEQVTRDFVLLWGALDLYARDHNDTMPARLEELVPRYLKELPKDPFATKATAEEKSVPATYVMSADGWGYRYRQGKEDSFVIHSVGLPDFPYRSDKGNVSLHTVRGTWLSGRQFERAK